MTGFGVTGPTIRFKRHAPLPEPGRDYVKTLVKASLSSRAW
jgi:hypothetical protein